MSETAAPSTNRPPAFRDLEHELAGTRRVLDRLPDEHWTWSPHVKSKTLGGMATHLVEVLYLAQGMLRNDVFDIANEHMKEPAGREELLRAYDAAAAELRAAADSLEADAWRTNSRLVHGARVIVELSRAAALRRLGINHLVHHRGQLTVYLRLLDVPVPGMYGPSADERGA